mmetsp:Transcript_2513/g.3809  ORF Transcript_2513/g.3809 Transcript_2513/m.3809 type:complete len:267 (+) Transcript_2513:243-1043(+)|eukprot:CAMPEP_0195518902 /NCGR_PEP_ID=MMETSP0794_2-20130614/13899_1 /TAXON_ID=515487 /ORGANISM="Stephanopyxis turris, Strain CCMP 815" /LENGTH=266 /DNA_ID=CAMNT_0040647943 /DNA_START=203 /DNA_END=1003 /DNA_ORIENTATION=+
MAGRSASPDPNAQPVPINADDLSETLITTLERSTTPSPKRNYGAAGYPSSAGGFGPFYDPDMTLEMSPSVARGFIVLLTGGEMEVPKIEEKPIGCCSSKKRNKTGKQPENGADEQEENSSEDKPEQDPPPLRSSDSQDTAATNDTSDLENLAFMALTDGNVVDTCFGVKAHTSRLLKPRGSGNHAAGAAKNAKLLLREAFEAHDAIRSLAVEAYANCFQTVIEYHQELRDTGLLASCWKSKKIREKAKKNLERAFEHLTGAVEASL